MSETPTPAPKPRLKIPRTLAVMSCPRLGFLDTMHCAFQHLIPLGINVSMVKGAFWGQCLERGLEAALVAGAEWVLAMDYDTVFDRRAVIDLLKLMAQHPEADAISPLQSKRADMHPLLCIMGADGRPREQLTAEELDASPLLKVSTAHFGLTLLRAEKLRRLPHPWFQGVPNGAGRWDEGRIDDDIWFWQEWEKAGNSLYVAHRVTVGHLQLMATWPSHDFTPIHQYVGDFVEHGKPAKARQ